MSDIPENLDLVAAEYVLGLLDEGTLRDIRIRSLTDPVLQAAIAAWQERLEPLTLLAESETPSPALWRRIASTTGITTPTPSRGLLAEVWRNVLFWRSAAALGFAAAAALLAFVLLREVTEQPLAALVPTGSPAAAFVAELQRDGSLRLVALDPVSVAQDKDLELWALPKGAARPIPVGLIPPTGTRLKPPTAPAGETQLLVSLEPRGGSPTGLPTGPVLFAGTLSSAR